VATAFFENVNPLQTRFSRSRSPRNSSICRCASRFTQGMSALANIRASSGLPTRVCSQGFNVIASTPPSV
jgi:hypothetical protein